MEKIMKETIFQVYQRVLEEIFQSNTFRHTVMERSRRHGRNVYLVFAFFRGPECYELYEDWQVATAYDEKEYIALPIPCLSSEDVALLTKASDLSIVDVPSYEAVKQQLRDGLLAKQREVSALWEGKYWEPVKKGR